MADDSDEDNPLPRWLEGDSLAPPCQAGYDVVQALLEFAGVTAKDIVYDLGCGDGRFCTEAAEKFGARSCGIEIEEDLVQSFRAAVEAKGLQQRVRVVHGDLLEQDLSDATIIVMYLLPEALALLEPKLIRELSRGCVVVCNTWGLKSLVPVRQAAVGPFEQTNLLMYTRDCLPP
eukprot:TRINITY_DN7213_c0_g1_i1.p1 TRINITY_DN7213_c0_g1~~TRINITY_DN7213_c0_g1_i1.p1  ORF type:complete len:175 (-),score=47.72 TRINITY_DN7213_c0_g1_i1:401-925(-)